MSNLKNIEKNYRILANNYEKRWQRFNAAINEWILAHLNRPERVIDLGCGTGLTLGYIHSAYKNAELTGIDYSSDMLSIASQRLPGAKLYRKDLSSLLLEDRYDLVISCNVLHHLSDANHHINLLHEACENDGQIFLCSFALESFSMRAAEQFWQSFHPAHNKSFSRKELISIIEPKFEIYNSALLKPDRFWQLQIYKLRKKTC